MQISSESPVPKRVYLNLHSLPTSAEGKLKKTGLEELDNVSEAIYNRISRHSRIYRVSQEQETNVGEWIPCADCSWNWRNWSIV